MALFIREADVVGLLTMRDAMDALVAMFHRWQRGDVINNPRRRIRIPSGYLMIMDGADIATVSGFKAYTAAGPRTNMLVHLYSSQSGELLAIIEANRLGALRTGAVSGIAADRMALADADTIGIIGSGRQAETQLQAICEVRRIKQIRVYSRSAERREAFAARMSETLGVATAAAPSARECVEESKIVVTATPSREPVLEGSWLSPGTLVIATGSNMWQRREIDESTIGRSEVIVVDDMETARLECGELIWAVERGAFRWESAKELRDVIAGVTAGRLTPAGVVLFESQGLAVEDLAAAWRVYELARARGVGTLLPMTS